MRPRRPRPDANQSSIVEDLRRLGYTVHNVSALGGDVLDLFVGGWSHDLGVRAWVQVEVKTEAGELRQEQAEYLARHFDWPIIIARCTEDILAWFGATDA